MDLTLLVDYAPYILILGGVAAASWILEKLAKPAPVVGTPVSGLVKIASVFGFFVGILMLVTAVGAWSAHAWDTGTRYLLIAAGLALFLKPLKDIPWAAVVGLIIGGACVSLVYFLLPLPETVLGVSSTWVYLAVFLVPALLSYMVTKFIEDVFKLVGTILSSRPVAIILGLLCIVQGVLLLLNNSLFLILFP
ncbi:MAG: hypothetical protein WCC63_03730 [Candidatus Bathyarchaeia archaeon]